MEKQITQEELQTIKNLQETIGQITNQLGAIEVKKIQLSEEILETRKKEQQLAKILSDKYGVGTLDIETGKLTVTDNK
jgi:septal ring factor EnvC (AmiA/AmiB activator)